MPAGSWITELAGEILGQSGNGKQTVLTATVASTSPLTIRIHGQVADRNLYINPAYLLTDVESHLSDLPPGSFGEFLKAFHEAFSLSVGDQLVVLFDGKSFYVLEKVVSV